METSRKAPVIAGSTANIYRCSITESKRRERTAREALPPGSIALEDTTTKKSTSTAQDEDETNYFKSAQWTPDGTSILTSSADNTIRTFIIPPTLLSTSEPTPLLPYTTHLYPSTINCLAPYPFFDLSSPTTTLYLSCPSALPIRLCTALSPTPTPVSTYSLISPTTEAYLTPTSLLWSASSPHTFLTGTDCLIALFDVSHPYSGPLTRLPTIPSKRHKLKGGGVGMRGIVSALSIQPSTSASFAGDGDGMLAAGTYTRWVGLYDTSGLGGTVATWSIAEAADGIAGIGGGGLTQTAWSACGKYLLVAERCSRGVLVYDVRISGKLVCWLEGRKAETNQRLGIDVFDAEGGAEVWAGGTDGVVRIWEGVGMCEGGVERSWEWKAHEDPISSTVVHNSGTVVATTSGKRSFPTIKDGSEDESEDESDDSSEADSSSSRSQVSSSDLSIQSGTPDNSLKLWSL